jgi:hypothetical protein
VELALDALIPEKVLIPAWWENIKFCICLVGNLWYCVYIPVMESGLLIAPKLEVVCVTGLPARTAKPFVPSFFACSDPRIRAHSPRSLLRSHFIPIQRLGWFRFFSGSV